MNKSYFKSTCEMMKQLHADPPTELQNFIADIKQSWRNDGKLISFGNGGSAADSLHFTAELIGQFRDEAIDKPAISLVSNSSNLTAISNDWSYKEVFSKQIQAQVSSEDILLGITTSGNSENVIEGLRMGKNKSIRCYGLTGGNPGKISELSIPLIKVPSEDTSHIQEAHITCLHYVCNQLAENSQNMVNNEQ